MILKIKVKNYRYLHKLGLSAEENSHGYTLFRDEYWYDQIVSILQPVQV